MSWEGYLKLLQNMFRMTNWKGATYTVAKHWATKSVMHYRDPLRGSWYTNTVEPTTAFSSCVAEIAKTSSLVTGLLREKERVTSVRFLSSVTREGVEVKIGDWVLMDQVLGSSVAARVEEVAEVVYEDGVHSCVRLWCTQCKTVEEMDDGSLRGAPGDSKGKMVVAFERVQVTVVVRTAYASHDEFA